MPDCLLPAKIKYFSPIFIFFFYIFENQLFYKMCVKFRPQSCIIAILIIDYFIKLKKNNIYHIFQGQN